MCCVKKKPAAASRLLAYFRSCILGGQFSIFLAQISALDSGLRSPPGGQSAKNSGAGRISAAGTWALMAVQHAEAASSEAKPFGPWCARALRRHKRKLRIARQSTLAGVFASHASSRVFFVGTSSDGKTYDFRADGRGVGDLPSMLLRMA